ncbi:MULTISPECIES: M16 family metallopeptidase [unclassified Algoriphagus]|jgi:predicted Zn-dependent peptidase|uniref:M16 family metallopeptidase n=2 Tax=Algoriphagus TaxID=246875 RepID=UPI00257DFDAE|nr:MULTISPECIES: pitrilysin family protein [unclassified Algoriphagus]|tara:strand:- start:1564 stop:2832 length:1269 start_codon:yes stop_codon:yes gene_type:complete
MLDRSLAPEFRIPDDFDLIEPEKHILQSGASVFHMPTPNLDAVKIEVIGKGQRANLPLSQTLLPSFTLQMLAEGTQKRDAEQIANFLDFHASEISPILTFGHEGMSILSTKLHIFEILPLFLEIIETPTFPLEMLAKRKSQRRLSIQLEKEKTASRASQLFRQSLFGKNHPYGVEIDFEHVDEIKQEQLHFYSSQLLWQNLEIFVTGNFSSSEWEKLIEFLEQIPNRKGLEPILLPQPESIDSFHEIRESAVQSSIRVGKFSIPKTHPDFIPLSVFNTILGGYFGSRLIKNIREDKGHTYGIYSSLAEIGDTNYFVIAADVQKAFTDEVIREIEHEVQLLCREPLNQDELEIVRNYQIGQMLSRFSSAFDLMDRFRAVHHSGLDLDFYQQKLSFLKKFTPEDILKIGQKYFKDQQLIQVIVG